MIFATFAPGTTKPDMAGHTRRYQAMLQTGAIRTAIFQAGEDQWCITAYDPTKALTVRMPWTLLPIKDSTCHATNAQTTSQIIQYLRDQPEVMKVTYEYQDMWQLRAFVAFLSSSSSLQRERN